MCAYLSISIIQKPAAASAAAVAVASVSAVAGVVQYVYLADEIPN